MIGWITAETFESQEKRALAREGRIVYRQTTLDELKIALNDG